jgi:hypothetical protein
VCVQVKELSLSDDGFTRRRRVAHTRSHFALGLGFWTTMPSGPRLKLIQLGAMRQVKEMMWHIRAGCSATA